MRIIISNKKERPVLCQYDGQIQPQPAYLELQPMLDGEIYLRADYSGEIGNAVPMDVWYNRVLRFGVPPEVTRAALRELEKDTWLGEALTKLRDDYDQLWKDGRWVGSFDEDLYYNICKHIEDHLYMSMME